MHNFTLLRMSVYTLMSMIFTVLKLDAPSQQSLPRQLDLPSRLASLVTALGYTDSLPIRQLNLFFVGWPRAGAVMGEVDARERVGAEVVAAKGCCNWLSC